MPSLEDGRASLGAWQPSWGFGGPYPRLGNHFGFVLGHLGPVEGYLADVGGDFGAKRAAKGQHGQLDTDILFKILISLLLFDGLVRSLMPSLEDGRASLEAWRHSGRSGLPSWELGKPVLEVI